MYEHTHIYTCICIYQIRSDQSLNHVRLFATPWITAHQASLYHQLPEFTQTHVHRVSDAIQPSHPLSSSSPSAPNSSRYFQDVISWFQSLPLLFLFFDLLSFILFFKFYFIFKLYIIVLVLPNIKMNLSQVYMCKIT